MALKKTMRKAHYRKTRSKTGTKIRRVKAARLKGGTKK